MTLHEEYFEYVDPDANRFKFWSYCYDDYGKVLQISWGRIGTKGQSKAFNNQTSVAVHERVNKKIREGYVKQSSSGNKVPLAGKTPPPTPDHFQNLYARMRARKDSTTGSPYGYTIVQCYEYTSHGAESFRDYVEVACVRNNSMIKLSKEFGVYFGPDELEEAEKLAYLLNHSGVRKEGQQASYPGGFSTIHVDGAGLATG